MAWTEELYERIRPLLQKPRGNTETDQLTFLQALQYIAASGCRWRVTCPKHSATGIAFIAAFGKIDSFHISTNSLIYR